jgi:predicted RNA methylase
MAQYDEEYDDSNLQGNDLVKHLRKQVKDLTRALEEREEEMEELYAATRESDLEAALEEVGVNPAIAAYVPDEVEDMDDLYNWLDANAEVFGIEAVEEGSEEEGGYDVDPELVAAAESMSSLTDGGVDPSVGQSIEDAINGAQSPDELMALLRNQ